MACRRSSPRCRIDLREWYADLCPGTDTPLARPRDISQNCLGRRTAPRRLAMTEPIELNETQRETLRAVCDTVVPRVDPPHEIRGEGRGDGFWTTAASDVGVDRALEQLIAGLPEDLAVGLFFLLEVLGAQGFAAASQVERERQLEGLAELSPDAALGVQAYRQLTLLLHYGLAGAAGS